MSQVYKCLSKIINMLDCVPRRVSHVGLMLRGFRQAVIVLAALASMLAVVFVELPTRVDRVADSPVPIILPFPLVPIQTTLAKQAVDAIRVAGRPETKVIAQCLIGR